MATDSPTTVSEYLSVLLRRTIDTNGPALESAKGRTGRIFVNLELHLVGGKPRWDSSSAYFAEHHQYEKES